jgi:hypothetical protein
LLWSFGLLILVWFRKIQSLSELNSEALVITMIKCFEKISAMLTDQDNFIDLKFLHSQNLKEATHKFKVCQTITQYLKVSTEIIWGCMGCLYELFYRP